MWVVMRPKTGEGRKLIGRARQKIAFSASPVRHCRDSFRLPAVTPQIGTSGVKF